jgi:hypothetical protein
VFEFGKKSGLRRLPPKSFLRELAGGGTVELGKSGKPAKIVGRFFR